MDSKKKQSKLSLDVMKFCVDDIAKTFTKNFSLWVELCRYGFEKNLRYKNYHGSSLKNVFDKVYGDYYSDNIIKIALSLIDVDYSDCVDMDTYRRKYSGVYVSDFSDIANRYLYEKYQHDIFRIMFAVLSEPVVIYIRRDCPKKLLNMSCLTRSVYQQSSDYIEFYFDSEKISDSYAKEFIELCDYVIYSE